MLGLLVLPSLVLAMPVLQVSVDGQLIGARNVEVEGLFYNVRFLDASCEDIVAGCNGRRDFVFGTEAAANLASSVLMDSVFLDGPLGQFDSIPQLTDGCSSDIVCLVRTPYELFIGQDGTRARTSSFFNYAGSRPDEIRINNSRVTEDSASVSRHVYTRWLITTPPRVVPEPTPAILLLLSLLGWTAARARKRA